MTDASAAMKLPSRRGLARKPRGMPVHQLAVVGGEPGPARRNAMTLPDLGPMLQGHSPCTA